MIGPAGMAVLDAGLIDPGLLRLAARWGVDLPDLKNDLPIRDLVGILVGLSYDDEDRVTDPTLPRQYFATAKQGTLHLKDGDDEVDIAVSVGRTKMGEYILPYRGDGLEDELLASGTRLIVSGKTIKITRTTPVHFGRAKVFILVAGRSIP